MTTPSIDTAAQRRISAFLVVYFIVMMIAVVFRIDRFPLTWAPMYSMNRSTETYDVSVFDQHVVEDEGYEIVHRDGTRGTLSHRDLNVPFRSFWQIYTQRTFGIGPPKHRRAIDTHGMAHEVEEDWATRVLVMINETLGYAPTDGGFVVEVRARRAIAHFEALHERPRLAAPVRTNVVTLTWRGERATMALDGVPPGLDE